MNLGELMRDTREHPVSVRGSLDVPVTGLVSDSRRATSGSVFFALSGARARGADFVPEAVRRGATAVVVGNDLDESLVPGNVTLVRSEKIPRLMSEMAAAFYGHPSRALVLVGVTGTNGKTTVTWLLESIWKAAGHRPGVLGTVSYRFGGHATPAPLTTPQAIELHGLLATMRDAGVSHAAMEVSSHALALDRVDDCAWDGAVFTNLSRDHLDFHPDLESYFAAKRRLFVELLPASPKPDRFAVVNRDDPWGRRLARDVEGRVLTFGRSPGSNVRARDVEATIDGLFARIDTPVGTVDVASSLVGDAHLENVLAATAVAMAQGIGLEAVGAGLRDCPQIPGRMERVDGGASFAVFVDYAHSPAAVERACRILRELARRRLVVVLGCGGDRDRGKRPLMGEAAARSADVVVVTSDNPRTEDPLRILAEIEPGVREGGLAPVTPDGAVTGRGYLVEPDRSKAIGLAIGLAREGDVVLVAGKGHEDYQIVGTERRHFDDREEARRWLGRGGPA